MQRPIVVLPHPLSRPGPQGFAAADRHPTPSTALTRYGAARSPLAPGCIAGRYLQGSGCASSAVHRHGHRPPHAAPAVTSSSWLRSSAGELPRRASRVKGGRASAHFSIAKPAAGRNEQPRSSLGQIGPAGPRSGRAATDAADRAAAPSVRGRSCRGGAGCGRRRPRYRFSTNAAGIHHVDPLRIGGRRPRDCA